MASQPVRAVILLFPITADSENKKEEEEVKIAKDGQPEIDPTIFWIKQTVRLPARSRCRSLTKTSSDSQCMRNYRFDSCSCKCTSNGMLGGEVDLTNARSSRM